MSDAPDQSMTLKLPYDLSDEQWERVSSVYQSMPGWKGFDPTPCWFGRENDSPRYIWASVEPSGLLVAGQLEDEAWAEWIASFQAQLSSALGFYVTDADS